VVKRQPAEDPRRLAARDAAALVAINLLWGSSYVVTRATLATVPPLTLACARFSLAWVVLAALAALGAWRLAPGRKEASGGSAVERPANACAKCQAPSTKRRLVPLVGLLGFSLTYLFTYHGLRLTTASDAALLVNLEAIFTALLGAGLLGERIGSRAAGGIAAALVGATLLLRPWGAGGEGPGAGAGRGWGNAILLVGLLFEAVATVLSRPLRREWPALALTRRLVGWGALGLLPLALFELWRGGAGGSVAGVTPAAVGGVLYLALGCTVLCYSVWYGLLGRIAAGRAAAFLYVQPVVGVSLGVTLQGDRLDLPLLAGGALILAGVAAASRG
jgi:drug/metabolite transporter (DMT)-like permease